jgi:hypothetical protein
MRNINNFFNWSENLNLYYYKKMEEKKKGMSPIYLYTTNFYIKEEKNEDFSIICCICLKGVIDFDQYIFMEVKKTK